MSTTATTLNPPTEWRCAAQQRTPTFRTPNAGPQVLSAIMTTLPQMNSGGRARNTSTITPAQTVFVDLLPIPSTLTTNAALVRWQQAPKSQWGLAGWFAHLKTVGAKTISWTCSRPVLGSTMFQNACQAFQMKWGFSPKPILNHSLTLDFTISTRTFSSREPPQRLKNIFRATSQSNFLKSTGAWINKLVTMRSKNTLSSLAGHKKKLG